MALPRVFNLFLSHQHTKIENRGKNCTEIDSDLALIPCIAVYLCYLKQKSRIAVKITSDQEYVRVIIILIIILNVKKRG